MGYIKHDAIVVTSWNGRSIEDAASEARDLGLQVLGPSDPVTNGYRSMLVCPDGSKENWATSNQGDQMRNAFIRWLEAQVYSDGSSPIDWVHIDYSPDSRHAEVQDHAWMKPTPTQEKDRP